MSAIDDLQQRKIIGISDGEVAMPVFYNEEIQDTKYFYTCNVIALAATIARTIDKDNLFRGVFYDVALKRTEEDENPSSLYAIGKATYDKKVKFGVYKIATANIDRNNFINVGWELYTSLPEPCIDGAITFDGFWDLTPDFKYYSLFTEDIPHIFYVNSKNILYRWDYKTKTKHKLADNVILCAAERGYFPREYEDLNSDQGVIIAYATKTNEIKYFTYIITNTGKKQWIGPETVATFSEGTIRSLQVHRLNDYRIGILVTTNNKSYWYITDRVYSQMAFRPERFNVQAPNITPIFHAAVRMDAINETPQPNFIWEINAEKTQITITSDSMLEVLDNYNLVESISGTANMPNIASVSCIEKTIIITFEKAAEATFTITFAGNNIRFAAFVPNMLEEAGGWVVIEPFSHEFEIFQTAEAKEHFNVIAPKLLNLSTEILPIYTIGQKANEHFNVAAPIVQNVSIEIKDAREKVEATENETFNVAAAQVTNISAIIEGIGIAPI